MVWNKIKSESVVQHIINSLVDAMIQRELRPGDKIPTEMELAESLGVGRNSVREAIKILVYLGVLEIRRAEGTFVCEGFSESMIDPMVYGVILDKADSYKDLMELREMMEVGVLQLAMKNALPNEMDKLNEALHHLQAEIQKGNENVENAFLADNDFHAQITTMSHNLIVGKIDKVVRTLTHAMRYESVKGMIAAGRGDELYEAHERIYCLLQNKFADNLAEAVRGTYFVDVGMESLEKESEEQGA